MYADIGVGGDVGIARHAEVVVGEVGEHRRRAAGAAAAGMAAVAIALVGAVEQRQPAQFGGRKTQAAGKEAVVLRVEGPEVGIESLVLHQREGHCQRRRLLVVENPVSEHLPELVRVRRGGEARDQVGGRRVGHFVCGKQRPQRLHHQVVGAAVAIEAAGGRAIGGETERRHEADVLQRRHGAKSRHVEVRPAQLH